MNIKDLLDGENRTSLFKQDCIRGKFDISGKIVKGSDSLTGGKTSFPDSLYNLLEYDDAESYLKKLSAGIPEKSHIFTLKTSPPVKVYWKEEKVAESLYYNFEAYPLDDDSVIKTYESHALLFGLQSGLPDLLLITEANGDIVYINPAGLKMLNIDKSQIANNFNIREIITNINNLDSILSRLKHGHVIQEIEVNFSRKESEDLIGLSSIFSLVRNETIYICFHVVDISERIRNFSEHMQNSIQLMNINEDLKNTQSRLLSQEKMASIGQLSAGIAHELNNPLGYVFNNMSVLFNYMKDLNNFVDHVRALYSSTDCDNLSLSNLKSMDENLDLDYIFGDLKELKNETEEGIKKIRSIINSLKSFSRKDSVLSFSPSNINESIKDTLVVLLGEYKYKIKVETDLGNIPDIFCNGLELNQVFLNILKNSIDAIKSENRVDMGLINIKTLKENSEIHIIFSDDGPGIPEEIKNRVFEPFFTTKAVGTGTGLGLSIAHDIIVNKHGGSISVEPLEKGAAFHIRIPFEEELESEA